ncbi:hypothetical protein [Rossellomorea marisflavi]|uniref:hypothetical protein n=1 Tax=Rossellomorea marisflavi TaxID=189381 RepID=UPI003FA1802D
MEDILYINENGKTVIEDDGDMVRLLQFYDDELVGEVTLYHEEIEKLYNLINKK